MMTLVMRQASVVRDGRLARRCDALAYRWWFIKSMDVVRGQMFFIDKRNNLQQREEYEERREEREESNHDLVLAGEPKRYEFKQY